MRWLIHIEPKSLKLNHGNFDSDFSCWVLFEHLFVTRLLSSYMERCAEPGFSVSHGTLRWEDLFPSFLDALQELKCQNEDYLRRTHSLLDSSSSLDLVNEAIKGLEGIIQKHKDDFSDAEIEELIEVFDCAWEALDLFAPEGYSFGVHPGDGSDYGFWPIESDG